MQRNEHSTPLGQRLLWFVALWCAGVGTVTLVAYGLRLWIVHG